MNEHYFELLKAAAPEVITVLTALVILGLSLASRRSNTLCLLLAAIGILFAITGVVLLPQSSNLFGNMLVISPLSCLFQVICLALAFFSVLLTHSDRWLPYRGEYLAIILFATAGLLILVSSEELLTIFIGLELLGLGLYIMTAFDKASGRAAEAGLKYFLFGSTASAFTLFGVSLIYGLTGSTALPLIAQKLSAAPASPLLTVGVVMTLIGFAFKIAAAPFHLWAPDAYEGAPIPSAAFIASGSKVASFVVLGRIVLGGFAPIRGSADWYAMVAGWSPVLAVLATLSILLGNFAALAQTNVRRLLAYSAVAHAGYTLLGLIAGSREGFSATLFYTSVYAVTLLGAFGVCAAVRHESGGDDLVHFSGLRARSPLLAGCMAVFILSLAGLPPLAGFFGKFFLFSAAFHSGTNHGLLWLVALALFGSLISLYYYLMVLKAIFIEPAAGTSAPKLQLSPDFLQSVTLMVLATAVLFFGILPDPLLGRIIAALSRQPLS